VIDVKIRGQLIPAKPAPTRSDHRYDAALAAGEAALH
jgi:hypothetical protein